MTFAASIKGLGIDCRQPHTLDELQILNGFTSNPRAMVVEICFNREDNVPEHDALNLIIGTH